MGITLIHIYEQRDMLRRGEEIARAAKQAEERERLRDHFAAAALTGLINTHAVYHKEPPSLAVMAFAAADAMLRERERTFDAKPRELSDDQRTLRNAADLLGPGGFKNLANELLSLSRRLADKSYAKSCKKCSISHTGRDADDRPEPIKDAESDRPQPIATGDTPVTHATPPQGSVQGEGTSAPVAWALMERDGFGVECTFTDRDEAAEWCDDRQQIVPLYRHPQPALTDDERTALRIVSSVFPSEKHAAALRGLLARCAIGSEERHEVK